MRVFITGASSGIGAAMAREYGVAGAEFSIRGFIEGRLELVTTLLLVAIVGGFAATHYLF